MLCLVSKISMPHFVNSYSQFRDSISMNVIIFSFKQYLYISIHEHIILYNLCFLIYIQSLYNYKSSLFYIDCNAMKNISNTRSHLVSLYYNMY